MKRRKGSLLGVGGPASGARSEIDAGRMRAMVAGPNVDTRHWVSWATVASVGGGDDGVPDYADPNAVLVTPAGVEVDVVLEPSGFPMTVGHGVSAGRGTILTPVRPGDRVLVLIADGDPMGGGEIIRVLPSNQPDHRIPLNPDGTPVFQNDRVLVQGADVPVEVRAGGAVVTVRTDGTVSIVSSAGADGSVLVNADGTVQVGGPGAGERMVLGDTLVSALTDLMMEGAGLAGAFAALGAAAVGPLAVLQPGFQTGHAAIAAFNLRLNTLLSQIAKLR